MDNSRTFVIMKQMEIWKDIKDYEGSYQVSNLGNVKSLPKIVRNDRWNVGSVRITKEKILKPKNQIGGYLYVSLYKEQKGRNIMIQRLVAKAFLEQGLNTTEVNHKDCNKKNNSVENLEWVTPKQNMQHAAMNARNPTYKLKAQDAVNIREYWNNNVYSKEQLSKMFNVQVRHIDKIIKNKIWNY